MFQCYFWSDNKWGLLAGLGGFTCNIVTFFGPGNTKQLSPLLKLFLEIPSNQTKMFLSFVQMALFLNGSPNLLAN